MDYGDRENMATIYETYGSEACSYPDKFTVRRVDDWSVIATETGPQVNCFYQYHRFYEHRLQAFLHRRVPPGPCFCSWSFKFLLELPDACKGGEGVKKGKKTGVNSYGIPVKQ